VSGDNLARRLLNMGGGVRMPKLLPLKWTGAARERHKPAPSVLALLRLSRNSQGRRKTLDAPMPPGVWIPKGGAHRKPSPPGAGIRPFLIRFMSVAVDKKRQYGKDQFGDSCLIAVFESRNRSRLI
jgi:hypothetical protein